MRQITFLIAALFLSLGALAQAVTVSGKIINTKGEPVAGATIKVKGAATSSTSDNDGGFTLKVADINQILVISSVGYKSQESTISSNRVLEIQLEIEAKGLAEVTVKGFSNIDSRARKRVESIQTIPESVVAVTQKEIELTNIKNIGALLTQIPGITYSESQDPGTVIISVRGIPQIRYGASPIATVVDGVYYASPDLVSQDFFDIDQIEVIKGSQGLFYGKNAIGGAVIMTSKLPKNKVGGRIKAGYANGNTFNLEGAVSGAITKDKVFFRLGTSYLKSDGLIENTFLHKKVDFRDDISVKGQLRFKLSGKTSLSFDGQVNNNKGGAVTFIASTLNSDMQEGNPNSYGGTPNADDLGKGTLKNNIFSASFETNFNNMRLSSYTSYANVKLRYTGDYLSFAPIDNYGPIPAALQEMDRNSKTFNEELRLVSTKKDSKLKWTLGMFYQNIKSDWFTNAYANANPADFNYTNTTQANLSAYNNSLNSL